MASIKQSFRGLSLMLALSALVTDALAQSNYGAVRGAVTDSQSATITHAMVSLISNATKLARGTYTNGSGAYVFSAVEPGSYSLVVTADGFEKSENKEIVIPTPAIRLLLDVKLRAGIRDAADGRGNRGGAGGWMAESTSYNGQLIDSQKLENLPNPGRNPFLFSKLDNNVTPVGDPRFVRFQDQSGSSTISVAGAPMSTNNYSIDGVPITDFSNRAVIIPSLEAVEEVKGAVEHLRRGDWAHQRRHVQHDIEVGLEHAARRTSGGNATDKLGGESLFQQSHAGEGRIGEHNFANYTAWRGRILQLCRRDRRTDSAATFPRWKK